MLRTIEADQQTGIDYDYGGKNQVEYILGEQVLSPFVDEVYSRLQGLPPESIVLDLGGGAGRFPVHAPEARPWRALGIDRDSVAIAQAQQAIGPQDRAIVGDITRLRELSFPEGMDPEQVAAAVSHRVLHAVPLVLQRPIVESVAGVLPQGAEFYASVAAINDWKAEALGAKPGEVHDAAPVMFGSFGVSRAKPFSMRFFDADTMAGLVQGTGLRIEGVSTFTEPSGYAHIPHKNTYLAFMLRKTGSANGAPRSGVAYAANGTR